ncbi:MAG: hypothetical protein A3E78_06685 [Alphaproteobacteria bacterium RIFCSPHIGHO2_12_FULL_63_12]|nr:MAG: hypothetical protein A3E78_06685 [Alphaproteobacteria bacterium RIFCSPHIGHO2_12_FULL_63_12]
MTAENIVPETISRVIDVGSLEETGARHVLEPTQTELAAIARRLGIPAVNKLRGEFELTPTHAGADVILRLDAETVRTCVASLEPMLETIREEIRMSFDRNYVEDDAEDFSEDDVLREPLLGGEIDIGELLVQHLSLLLDPYPRKTDAESLAGKFRDATLLSPFSSLKGLVDRES